MASSYCCFCIDLLVNKCLILNFLRYIAWLLQEVTLRKHVYMYNIPSYTMILPSIHTLLRVYITLTFCFVIMGMWYSSLRLKLIGIVIRHLTCLIYSKLWMQLSNNKWNFHCHFKMYKAVYYKFSKMKSLKYEDMLH